MQTEQVINLSLRYGSPEKGCFVEKKNQKSKHLDIHCAEVDCTEF